MLISIVSDIKENWCCWGGGNRTLITQKEQITTDFSSAGFHCFSAISVP